MIVKSPQKINDIFNDIEYKKFKSLFPIEKVKNSSFDEGFSRYCIGDNELPDLMKAAESLVPMARQIFESETLLPTYSLFAHYEGSNANLFKHVDANACTYIIDMCVYQNYAWDLWVENKPYTLYPNEALAYYGNDQMHWREEFPMKDKNFVAMVFFHFAEPDHWWFTKGRSYVEVIRGKITEEQWSVSNGHI